MVAFCARTSRRLRLLAALVAVVAAQDDACAAGTRCAFADAAGNATTFKTTVTPSPSTLSTVYEQRPAFRALLDLNDGLRSLGLGTQLDLPRIVVVGDQSAGKSSVLEAISGVQLLRGTGFVTRAPIELRLVRSASPGCRAVVSAEGSDERTRVGCDGVGEALNATMRKLVRAGGGVSERAVRCTISSPSAPDLTLVDLPGLARVSVEGQSRDVPAVTKALAQRYAAPARTVILVVVPCNADLATAEALKLARDADPDGARTVGVLTKPDLMDPGTEGSLAAILDGHVVKLAAHGWYVVLNRGQRALDARASVADALDRERTFFDDRLAALRDARPARFGVPRLVAHLGDVLGAHIAADAPGLARVGAAEARRRRSRRRARVRAQGLPRVADDGLRVGRARGDAGPRRGRGGRSFAAELLDEYRGFHATLQGLWPGDDNATAHRVAEAVEGRHGREAFYGFPSYAAFASLPTASPFGAGTGRAAAAKGAAAGGPPRRDFLRAKVDRYFEILERRVADLVPMAVDMYLVQEFGHDLALQPHAATMVRKRVDERVRRFIEEGVALEQRSLVVLVGDYGKDQVVNLHAILSKARVRARPSVLWCYKKELGFSTHRKKRMKAIKKQIALGLHDATDEPFELFISQTDIRWCYYRDTHKILGATYGTLVLQDFEALTPNLLARTIETVEGGGLVVVLLRTVTSLKQLYAMSMDVHARFRGSATRGECVPRFNERFILSLADCRRCLVLDDELNVLPLSRKHVARFEDAPPDAPPPPSAAVRAEIEDLAATLAAPPGGRARHGPVAGERGHGLRVPARGARALHYSEHGDYEVLKHRTDGGDDVPVRVNVYTKKDGGERTTRQVVQYVSPGDPEKLSHAELLVIDEAAALPLPTVKKLLGPYVVFLASTAAADAADGVRGVAHAKKGDLKLHEARWAEASAAAKGASDAGGAKSLRELALEAPIRYAAGDDVEAWLHRALCLDSPKRGCFALSRGLPAPAACGLYEVDRDALFSYHALSERSRSRGSSPRTSPGRAARGERAAGDLVPWTLSQQFCDPSFAKLSGARVVRVATHPDAQRMGYGAKALADLVKYFEGDLDEGMEDDDEDEDEDEAAAAEDDDDESDDDASDDDRGEIAG
ncbi:pyruvate carboxylase [Aureococcus anophagefferens]|nr:pyruvate carboxylase [Aureococcus anophagefferens]